MILHVHTVLSCRGYVEVLGGFLFTQVGRVKVLKRSGNTFHAAPRQQRRSCPAKATNPARIVYGSGLSHWQCLGGMSTGCTHLHAGVQVQRTGCENVSSHLLSPYWPSTLEATCTPVTRLIVDLQGRVPSPPHLYLLATHPACPPPYPTSLPQYVWQQLRVLQRYQSICWRAPSDRNTLQGSCRLLTCHLRPTST
jgi:hypothetical protein